MSDTPNSQPFITLPEDEPVPQIDQAPASNSSQPMRNIKDLVVLLESLQKRIEAIEKENRGLKTKLAHKITKKEAASIVAQLDQFRLPKLAIFSDSFFLRALAIYGHWWVINIIFSILFSILAFIIISILGPSIFGNLMSLYQ
ncbi:MAG: hypothetical protein J7K85_00150 [Anaerolineaceae bacterium]|nr:hypothetical protein [Anaerolineaceae bacterium]